MESFIRRFPLSSVRALMAVSLLAILSLTGCKKPKMVAPAPAPAPTPHVYQLGEPRPITLNDLSKTSTAHNSAVHAHPQINRAAEAEARAAQDREERARVVAQLQRQAEESKLKREAAENEARARWEIESSQRKQAAASPH